MKQQVWAYRAFNYGFAAFFLGAAVLVVLRHENPYLPLGRVQLLAVAVLLGVALTGGLWLWSRCEKLHRWEKPLAAALLVGYFTVQLFVSLLLQVRIQDTWDFPLVASHAQTFILEGSLPTGTYYAWFGNNAPLFWVYAGLFGLANLFGVTDFMPWLVGLSCICVVGALALLFSTARRLFGPKWSVPVLLVAMLSPALFLHGPIVYTDTLTLLQTMGAVRLWLLARDAWTQGKAAKGRWLAAAAFGAAALGAVLKVSVLILAMAFVIDLIFLWQGRGKWLALAAGICLLTVLMLGLGNASRAALPDSGEEKIPYTHWVMMGLHDKGKYWDLDYKMTLSYDTEAERRAFNLQEIRRRLTAMGPAGFADHCMEKLSYVLSDGTCYAAENLDRGPRTPSPLHEWIVRGGKYAGILYYFADAYQLCLIAGCAMGGLRAARGEKYRSTVLRVAVFGLLVFLLLWEANSRYIVNFLPMLILAAVTAWLPEHTA